MFSAIWKPTLNTGFRLDIGSWKIIEISLPRISRMRDSENPSTSCPSNTIRPLSIRPVGEATSRSTDSAVTLLPQPDSPTMPSVPPAGRSKLTPSTAGTTPSSVWKYVRRSCTESSGA